MHAQVQANTELNARVQRFLQEAFRTFPWTINVVDWSGNRYSIGTGESQHWRNQTLTFRINNPDVGKDMLRLDGLRILERYVEGDIDFEGNLYLLGWLRMYAGLELNRFKAAYHILKNRAFQNIGRARVNVKSHYDIPQEILDAYLDQVYKSYSCGIWQDPNHLELRELLRFGKGEQDAEDTLEKAQWNKFADAADFANPRGNEEVLDIGCGYGGQLIVGMERFPNAKFVGWTHSTNQATVGNRMLREQFGDRPYELHEGDYRQETRQFDHVLSTGMVSHVGPPPGLLRYVQDVRKLVKPGGRYMHHALMHPWSRIPHSFHAGAAFCKKYVWPGFHWYPVEEHIETLIHNGFVVEKVVNLSLHYGKTTASWYERMMARKDEIVDQFSRVDAFDSNCEREPERGLRTFKAWQIYLAGASAGFRTGKIHVYRIYCTAK